MTDHAAELLAIADKIDALVEKSQKPEILDAFEKIKDAATEIGKSWSGSNMGYHANVYYLGLETPPAGAHFSPEWGFMDSFVAKTVGDWREWQFDDVVEAIHQQAGNPDIAPLERLSKKAVQVFDKERSEIISILSNEADDAFIGTLSKEAEEAEYLSGAEVVRQFIPSRQVMTRDSTALTQGFKVPPHIRELATIYTLQQPIQACRTLSAIARKAGSHLIRKNRQKMKSETVGTNVFIGHGRSHVWRDLKDFIKDRLHLPHDEFNRVPVAGVTNIARLSEMLDSAAIAFVVMTGEDEQVDGKTHARMNVVHEAGLFQGRLGFTKAIVLLEEGCEEFTNIQGLGQIRFPKGNIKAVFEDIRAVLEREGIILEEEKVSTRKSK